jgi:hypothetical protein
MNLTRSSTLRPLRLRSPASARAARGHTRWVQRFVRALAAVSVLGLACTLTSDDYEPAHVESDTLANEAGGGATVCEASVECCADVACAEGEQCSAGACRPPPEVPAPVLDAGACLGADCSPATPAVLVPSCDDTQQNGDETDVDCGGSCDRRCPLDRACAADVDCAVGLYCSEPSLLCAVISCSDGSLNGDERETDCGGGTCAGCGDGADCAGAVDCASGVCGDAGTCAAPSCSDEVQNQDETGVDCGGGCAAACAPGAGCAEAEDCTSRVCAAAGCGDGVTLCCQAPDCDDDTLNGSETALDCGGACGPCPNGTACSDDVECQSAFCELGECEAAPTCDDFELNGNEVDVDCGGGTCAPCEDGATCLEPDDCDSGNCADDVCISCSDGEQNGGETAEDCGGIATGCPRCAIGLACASNDDCAGAFCVAAVCQ